MKKNKKISITKRKPKEDGSSEQSNKQKQIKALFSKILPYLLWDYFEMEGLFKTIPRAFVLSFLKKEGFNFDPKDSIDVIKILSRFFLILNLKPSKILPQEIQAVRETIEKAKPEIDRIWANIKGEGLSGRLPQPELKWKRAALNRFDDSKMGFKSIKREFLEDPNIYRAMKNRFGHEKAEFGFAISQKIILRELKKTFSKETLRKLIRNGNRQKLKFVGKPTR